VPFEYDGVGETKFTGVACVKLIKDVVVGLEVALDLELLGENSAAAIEFTEKECSITLSINIKHPNLLEPPFVLNDA
jgi:hypothetical protein